MKILFHNVTINQSQWPHCLRRRSRAARLLRLWVWIPPGTWMSVCCECCVLSGRGLCDAIITLPEESYRLWCVVVCDLETSRKWEGHGPRWAAAPRGDAGGCDHPRCILLYSLLLSWHLVTFVVNGNYKCSCAHFFIFILQIYDVMN